MLKNELIAQINPDLRREQHFFDAETLGCLGALCAETLPVVCVCAPRLGAYLVDAGLPVAIIDNDPRIKEIIPDQVILADITRPDALDVLPRSQTGTLIMDPPFDMKSDHIVNVVTALLPEEGKGFLVFPRRAGIKLMEKLYDVGILGEERRSVDISYQNPPRIAQQQGIGIFELVRVRH